MARSMDGEGDTERRRMGRVDTHIDLNCRTPATPCRATMRDVSASGCRLLVPFATLALGGTALLELPGQPRFAGRVVWIAGKSAGIQFERPLGRAAAVALGLLDEDEV